MSGDLPWAGLDWGRGFISSRPKTSTFPARPKSLSSCTKRTPPLPRGFGLRLLPVNSKQIYAHPCRWSADAGRTVQAERRRALELSRLQQLFFLIPLAQRGIAGVHSS